MRMIKYTHACVRLEAASSVLVIDPGTWSEPVALDGAHAVLLTHEHFDHVDVDRLRAAVASNRELRVWAPTELAAQLSDLGPALTAVRPGDPFSAAEFAVRTFGERHAVIHSSVPPPQNIGYLVTAPEDGTTVFHPGDSFTVPEAEVHHLLVPAAAPWLKSGESIDWVRAVRPRRTYPIHDAMLSEIGQQIADRWIREFGGADFQRLSIAEPIDL
jgi:L-ascorbate metabolism protein UlaG (beta-lactamase superfamily)